MTKIAHNTCLQFFEATKKPQKHLHVENGKHKRNILQEAYYKLSLQMHLVAIYKHVPGKYYIQSAKPHQLTFVTMHRILKQR